MTETLLGPAWSAKGLDVASGRYPLAVERHVMRMVDLLVRGVTAVTSHARYYGLHALVAADVQDRVLDADQARDLLRRAEVAMAAVSYWHEPHALAGLPAAHGLDALAGALSAGEVDMAQATGTGPGAYATRQWGFWNSYFGSELSLQILTGGPVPLLGDTADAPALRAALGPLLSLARQDRISKSDTQGSGSLCVCGGATSADGPWLAALMCGQADAEARSNDAARRGTIRMLARLMQLRQVGAIWSDLVPAVAFGTELASDPILSSITVAPVWRGVVLRNYSVGAWRRLWSWLVAQVGEPITRTELAETFADQLPSGTVDQFVADLPTTVVAGGGLNPGEQQLRDSGWSVPRRELAVLAVNARRAGELPGRTLEAFLGDRHGADFAPEWFARRLDAAPGRPLRDFARELVEDMLRRANRVAMSKAQRRSDGSLWVPARIHERGEILFRTSTEGAGDVGLRWESLTTVLAGAGVLARIGDTWHVTAAGGHHLDLPQ